MANDVSKTDDKLCELLNGLKTSDNYANYDDIRHHLMLSSSVSVAQLEALIIAAAQACFCDDSLKMDIVLMSLGLLKGYDQIADGRRYTKRIDKFFQESSYIHRGNEDIERLKWASYEEAKKDRAAEKRIQGTPTSNCDTYVGGIAERLSEWNASGQIQNRMVAQKGHFLNLLT